MKLLTVLMDTNVVIVVSLYHEIIRINQFILLKIIISVQAAARGCLEKMTKVMSWQQSRWNMMPCMSQRITLKMEACERMVKHEKR